MENWRTTTGTYLDAWLAEKRQKLRPSTYFNHERYVRMDLIPALGTVPLQQLHHVHVQRFIDDMGTTGRGATTIRRIITVLSSALRDGVKRRQRQHNVAEHATLPDVERTERSPWSAAQTVAFLDHVTDDRLGPLFEVLVGCGLRRGEALALQWEDIDIDARSLFVRRTLSDVGGHLVFGEPKTRASSAGIGLPSRVVAALEVQAM